MAAEEVLLDTRFDEHIRSSHINSFAGFLGHPSSKVTREVFIALDPGECSGGTPSRCTKALRIESASDTLSWGCPLRASARRAPTPVPQRARRHCHNVLPPR